MGIEYATDLLNQKRWRRNQGASLEIKQVGTG